VSNVVHLQYEESYLGWLLVMLHAFVLLCHFPVGPLLLLAASRAKLQQCQLWHAASAKCLRHSTSKLWQLQLLLVQSLRQLAKFFVMKLSARVPVTPTCGSLNRGVGQTGPLVLMWCECMMVKSTCRRSVPWGS
jgi:hypothetical protein